jgi:signal transduction histidine kinase
MESNGPGRELSIRMAAEVLSRGADAAACEAYARRIVRNVEHADDLIQNLLDASRASAGEMLAVNRVACDVFALVVEAVQDQAVE